MHGLLRIDGFAGAYALRRDAEGEVARMTITLFELLQAIQAFAGNESTQAHVTTETGQRLSRFERTATHYEVVLATDNSV